MRVKGIRYRVLFGMCLILLSVTGGGCTFFKRLAYEGFGRDHWQHAEEVVRALQIKSGDHVADLGSGSGYFTFRLADAVGPEGKVYATDVDSNINEYLARRIREKGYRNIEVIQAEYGDPLLPDWGVDMIFTCNTYHHLKDRVSYFANAKKYLRPGGRITIIDFKEKAFFPTLFGHYTPKGMILAEMAQSGYRLQSEFFFLSKQNFLVFSKSGKRIP